MGQADSMVMFRPSQDALRTIMVLDLCGSTEMAGENELMAVHLNRRLEQISSNILEANKADSFKNTGDGFLATFPDTVSAVVAAFNLLDRLAERNRRTVNPPIHVRLALHYGRTYHVVDSGTKEIYGHDVNIAFRIERLLPSAFVSTENPFPERNRILCSKQFYESISTQSSLPPMRFVKCGVAQLKGVEDAVEIYHIEAL